MAASQFRRRRRAKGQRGPLPDKPWTEGNPFLDDPPLDGSVFDRSKAKPGVPICLMCWTRHSPRQSPCDFSPMFVWQILHSYGKVVGLNAGFSALPMEDRELARSLINAEIPGAYSTPAGAADRLVERVSKLALVMVGHGFRVNNVDSGPPVASR